ncbi:hypothetical protein U9M48_009755 [Paspalum notatum var. saurae]|uniref:MULE transposase domain-containing protein n=1 Tax=Paspalum notatum var. saurae TaxID=547442 RepID=A0AAQ3SS59_PASNO
MLVQSIPRGIVSSEGVENYGNTSVAMAEDVGFEHRQQNEDGHTDLGVAVVGHGASGTADDEQGNGRQHEVEEQAYEGPGSQSEPQGLADEGERIPSIVQQMQNEDDEFAQAQEIGEESDEDEDYPIPGEWREHGFGNPVVHDAKQQEWEYRDNEVVQGKYKGTILTAIGVDGNNLVTVLPVAFAFVENENADSWYWFLERVKTNAVSLRSNVCLISDRHSGILDAIEKLKHGNGASPPLWSDVHSQWCMRHLAANFYDYFKNKDLQDLFKSLCSQNQQRKFNAISKLLDELTAKHQTATSSASSSGRTAKPFSQWIQNKPKEPYSAAAVGSRAPYGLSSLCTSNETLWYTTASLVYYIYIEPHCPHRAMRQFGYAQQFPVPRVIDRVTPQDHRLSRLGQPCSGTWVTKVEPYVEAWDNAHQDVVHPVAPHTDWWYETFLTWYRPRTRCHVTYADTQPVPHESSSTDAYARHRDEALAGAMQICCQLQSNTNDALERGPSRHQPPIPPQYTAPSCSYMPPMDPASTSYTPMHPFPQHVTPMDPPSMSYTPMGTSLQPQSSMPYQPMGLATSMSFTPIRPKKRI